MKKKNKEITVKDLLDIFLPKIWIILLVGVLFAGASVLYSTFVKKETYTSYTSFYVQKSNANNSSTVTTDIDLAEQMVDVFTTAIYKMDKFLDLVANKYPEYKLTSASIRSMMTVERFDETPFLRIYITHTNPQIAYDVANEISNLAPQMPVLLSANGLQVGLVDSPIEPTANSKNTVRNAVIFFLIGIVLMMALVWILSLLDVFVRTSQKIEDLFDLPVLAVIPKHEVVLEEAKK